MTIKSTLSMQKRRKKGFTLTEIAIVLGIIGLILGSIWVAASSVYSNVKTANAQRTILSTAQAVRSLYTSSNGSVSNTSTAALLTAPGMLPLDYVSSTWFVNPWNLNAAGSETFISGAGTVFDVEMDNIPSAACVTLLSAYASGASATNGGNIAGLAGTGANTTAAAINVPKVITTGSSIPTTFAAATAANCGNSTSGGSNVAVVFDMSKM